MADEKDYYADRRIIDNRRHCGEFTKKKAVYSKSKRKISKLSRKKNRKR